MRPSTTSPKIPWVISGTEACEATCIRDRSAGHSLPPWWANPITSLPFSHFFRPVDSILWLNPGKIIVALPPHHPAPTEVSCMHCKSVFPLICLLLSGSVGLPQSGGAEPASAGAAKASGTTPAELVSGHVKPLLAKYCLDCHSGTRAKAGLDLTKVADDLSIIKDRKLWGRLAEYVEAGDMPPEGRPQPTQAEVEQMTQAIEEVLANVDCGRETDPGRVTMRRLNRAEYNNTIRDLVGVDFQPADDFPSDDVGYGFDNIGDVLTLPPLLFEKYLAAAEVTAEKAILATAGADPQTLPDSHKRILFCMPTAETKSASARAILERFASRAYRRPASAGEVARLIRFVDLAAENGESFERGIQLAVEAVLCSPQFLFRVEFDPRSRRGEKMPPTHPVSEFELATRLSYFLWCSMPDEELTRLASESKLRTGDTLEQQVKRMLSDPKARGLVENFGDQWLQLRLLGTINPDTGQFPTFDDELRRAMLEETRLFLASVMRDDRSVLDFLDANDTFVNERLALHYGIPGIKGDEFRQVTLPGDQRGGLLGQASILTVTSNPTRTSPVKRGRWILEQILGTPPPPPPPNVPELKEGKDVVLSGTLRQRMEQHRTNPDCATCHSRMDPLGFGLENFDAVGAWRDKEGTFAIDASGTLPDGRSFAGPKALKAILKQREAEFARCLSEKLLTFALGRGLDYYDKCAVDRIVAALAHDDYRFSTLVLGIVNSDPFQKRRQR